MIGSKQSPDAVAMQRALSEETSVFNLDFAPIS